jgi:hypothetical protein
VAEHLASTRSRPAEDDFRDRTITSSPILADALRRGQPSRLRARVHRRDRLPAQDRAGRSDRSYGIQVARLAGLPARWSARGGDSASLEQDELQRGGRPSLSGAPAADQRQLGLFQPRRDAPPSSIGCASWTSIELTPLDALNLLAELKREAGE